MSKYKKAYKHVNGEYFCYICRDKPRAGDPDKIKTDIRDAVFRVSDLPESVSQKPVIDEMKASNIPVLEIALSGSVKELELRKYAKELESRLKEVPGVSRIAKTGYRKREIRINADLKKIKKNVISLSEIMNAVKSRIVLFDSYLQPSLIMSVIPFAIISVFLTLLLHNLPLTFISLLDMLGLIGVVINDKTSE